jgi:hypothetical protein
VVTVEYRAVRGPRLMAPAIVPGAPINLSGFSGVNAC